MKPLLLFFILLANLPANAQRLEMFKGIDLDSSYSIVCLNPNPKDQDSLAKYWFYVDDPQEMKKMAKDWIFTKRAEKVSTEYNSVEVLVVKDKRPIDGFGIIFTGQKIITKGYTWYKCDMDKLSILHQKYPLNSLMKTYRFDNYLQYVAFANSHMNDSTLLFFFEPSLHYEGSFSVVTQRINDPTGMFTLRDLNLALRELTPANTFTASYSDQDSLNKLNERNLRIEVKCAKTLYDRYENKNSRKSEWTPTPIEMKSYWKN